MKFSIIITVFNNLQVTLESLKSIANQSFTDYETIIVNNSSEKQSELQEIKHLKNYKYINAPRNLLYSKSINLAFQETAGDFIIVLNSDVILQNDFLKTLDLLTQKNKITSATPVIYKEDSTIDSCGIKPGLTMRPIDMKKVPVSYKAFGPAGSAFIIKKSACLEMIKYFGSFMDEKISFFYSDLAFAYRLQRLDIKTSIFPDLKAYHYRGSSTPQVSSFLPFRFCKLSTPYKKLLITNRSHFLTAYTDKTKILHKLPFIILYNKLLNICLTVQSFPQRYKYKTLLKQL